jgi:hypothetical protein
LRYIVKREGDGAFMDAMRNDDGWLVLEKVMNGEV